MIQYKDTLSVPDRLMASGTGNLGMHPVDLESRGIMIKCRDLPLAGVMATLAIGFSITFKLPEMDILMTITTVRCKYFKNLGNTPIRFLPEMASPACLMLMGSGQREPGGGMLKTDSIPS